MKTIIIDNIRVPVEKAFKEGLDNSILSAVRVRLGTADFEYEGLYKKALDARRKGRISHVISARIGLDDSFVTGGIKNLREIKEYENIPLPSGDKKIKNPPVVVGSGPCGLFCAYILASEGYEPVIIERGEDIDSRKEAVRHFWKSGVLDTESNVQFGEGGAGTFSDGKLVTRINDRRCDFVINKLIDNGAPRDIGYEARPHIGTDALGPVIRSIRNEIIRLGGRFLFKSKVTGIDAGDSIRSVRINDEYDIPADILVIAIGHSARDTYEMLFEKGLAMEAKSFSAGVRIEHLQSDVNYSQWGKQGKYISKAADYSLSKRFVDRAAYTFCMCPGGVVVNASSENEALTVNGMSYNLRNGKNANSAWVAEVKPTDLGSSHPLGGIKFQREIEKAAFTAGGGNYMAPVQLLGDFIDNRSSSGLGKIKPAFTGRTNFSNINDILPEFIAGTLKSSLESFKNKLTCFFDKDAVLTGCETRTSAPVRILRDQLYESISVKGIYPAGEGAGYAGGIMSASVDGIKVAESIIKLYNYSG